VGRSLRRKDLGKLGMGSFDYSFDLPGQRAAVPYLEQYFGLWAMRPEEFHAGVQIARSIDLHVHMASEQALKAQGVSTPAAEVKNDIAIVTLHGTLMKHTSSMSAGTSTVLARRQIRAAGANDNVKGLLLHIDSPGGTAAGTQDLAHDIAELAARKPVYAYCEDLTASAAYWAASQATKVFANESALVGSIGTYGVVHDLSKLAENEGIKVHVIRAGDFKGMGEPGTEVTDEQLAELQRIVNEMNDFFIRGVSKGRGMTASQVRKLADGRVHTAGPAQGLGLIDKVQSLDATFAQLVKDTRKVKGTKMSQENETTLATVAAPQAPRAATLKELRAACPGADSDFIVAAADKELTVAQAQSEWMAEQNRRIQTLQAAAKKTKAEDPADDEDDEEEEPAAKKKAKKATTAKVGVEPLKSSGGKSIDSFADPIAEWDEAVQANVKRGMTKQRAVMQANRDHPELREAMVLAHNEKHGRGKQARDYLGV